MHVLCRKSALVYQAGSLFTVTLPLPELLVLAEEWGQQIKTPINHLSFQFQPHKCGSFTCGTYSYVHVLQGEQCS